MEEHGTFEWLLKSCSVVSFEVQDSTHVTASWDDSGPYTFKRTTTSWDFYEDGKQTVHFLNVEEAEAAFRQLLNDFNE